MFNILDWVKDHPYFKTDYSINVPRKEREFKNFREFARHNETEIYDSWVARSKEIVIGANQEDDSQEETVIKEWRYIFILCHD